MLVPVMQGTGRGKYGAPNPIYLEGLSRASTVADQA